MSFLRSRRRRATVIAVVSGLVVAALLPVSAVVAWRAGRDSRAAEAVIALPTMAIPTTPTAILGVTDDQNFLTSLAVLAIAPSGAGGTIVSMPVGMSVSGRDADDPRRLADVYGSDGPEALREAVQANSSSEIDLIAVESAAGTGDLIARVGTVAATFPRDVVDTEDDDERVVAEAGENSFSPIQAANVLAARLDGTPESTRLPDVKILWEAIADAVGAGKIGTTPVPVIPDVGAQTPADMATFMSALFAGPVRVWQIGYQAVPEGNTNPEGIDLYGYDYGEVVMVLASVAPSAMVAVLPTLSLQVDSSYPDSEILRQAVFRLLYMGANVLLVRNTTTPTPEMTTIYYSDETDRGMAEPLTILLDEVQWEKATERVAGVDLRVVLGESFVRFLEETAGVSLDEVAASKLPPTTTVPEDE
ncbi:MAG: hypothetical protein ACO3WI_02830 [Ilumatobacteraceae bacterium]